MGLFGVPVAMGREQAKPLVSRKLTQRRMDLSDSVQRGISGLNKANRNLTQRYEVLFEGLERSEGALRLSRAWSVALRLAIADHLDQCFTLRPNAFGCFIGGFRTGHTIQAPLHQPLNQSNMFQGLGDAPAVRCGLPGKLG